MMGISIVDLDNDYVREMWNGAWFMLTLSMLVALLAIAWDRLNKMGVRPAYADLGVQICLAFAIFVTASGLRAGYIWTLLHCRNFQDNCLWVERDDWIMTVAGMIAFVGGLCVIRVMSPPKWRPWSWVVAGLISVGLPMVYYGLGVPSPNRPPEVGGAQRISSEFRNPLCRSDSPGCTVRPARHAPSGSGRP